MKPIRLQMTAFGPFGKEVTIDFASLNDSSLFLISGDTGSGKTTIFDAIAYALYGESSNEKKRKMKGFRSDYALSTVKTSVSFCFEHKNKTYLVERSFNEKESSAMLQDIEGNILADGVKETNKYVFNLIRLTKSQFSQTVMIAQNDFLKILNTSSKERNELLKNVFDTHIYEAFQALMLEEVQAVEENYKKQLVALKTWSEMIPKACHSFEEAQHNIDELEEIIKFQEKEAQKTQILMLNNRHLLSDVETKINHYVQQNKMLEEVSCLQEKLRMCDENSLQQKEASLQLMEKSKKKADLLSDIQEKEKSLKEYHYAIETYTKEIESQYEVLKEVEAFLENEQTIIHENELLQNDIQILEEKQYHIKEMKKKKADLDKKVKELASLEEKTLQIQSNIRLKSIHLLTDELKEGEPCPVCGSCHHPKIPVVGEVYEETSTDVLKVYERLVSEVMLLKESVEEIEQKESVIIEQLMSLKSKQHQLTKTLSDKKYQKSIINALILEKQKSRSNAEKSYLIFKDMVHLLKEQLCELGEFEMVPYETLNIEKKELEDRKNEFQKASSQLEVLLPKLSIKEPIDTQVLQLEKEDLTQKQNDLQKQMDTQTVALAKYKEIKEKMSTILKEYAHHFEKDSILMGVAKLVNGKLQQAQKITFEMYVQRYYFQKVITKANKQLEELQNDQYVLRVKPSSSKQGYQGLDLEVLDNYTGHYRDVSTLSGGESFVVALALAIGFSEVVQENSGQVRIEAMFIDEGFGSLDENALRSTICLLNNLANRKMCIGIISHVAVLKQLISQKILVTKSALGSSVKVVSD